MATCRLILCCNSSTRVIEPLRSRCLAIRVAAPSATEIIDCLQSVCKKEGLTLPPPLAQRIAEQADGNLRKALLMLEASKAAQYVRLPLLPLLSLVLLLLLRRRRLMTRGPSLLVQISVHERDAGAAHGLGGVHF